MQTLFDIPATHTVDPITSFVAEDKISKSGKRQAHIKTVIDVLEKCPELTYSEIAVRCGLSDMQVERRLCDLKKTGIVKVAAERICSIKKSLCSTYYLRKAPALYRINQTNLLWNQ